jgi:hypothetical protein
MQVCAFSKSLTHFLLTRKDFMTSSAAFESLQKSGEKVFSSSF